MGSINYKAADSVFKATLIQNVSVFLSCAVVGALIFCHLLVSSP